MKTQRHFSRVSLTLVIALLVGADAGITIFDPETVQDNSTTQQAGLPSTGIQYVIVNGTVVVKDSKVLKGVHPGQAIRLPVM